MKKNVLKLRIMVTSYDLESNGHLHFELRVLDGDKILKSAIYTATVDYPALTTDDLETIREALNL